MASTIQFNNDAFAVADGGDAAIVSLKPQTALTAANALTIDGTYDTNEQNTITNLRTRVNEIEARLKAAGFLPS